jgi:ABC-type Fe3+ transport system permease subunit
VETIAWETISLHTAGRANAAMAVAAVPALIAIAAAAAYVLRYGGALDLEMPFAQGRARPQPLGRWRPLATAFVAVTVAASLGFPLAGLILGAGSVGAVAAAAGATSRQLAVTLACAAGAATIAVAAGIAVARVLRGPGRTGARTAGAALAALPMAVPGATLALGLLALWNRPVLYEALLAAPTGLAVAVGIRFLFFGVASALAASATVPGEIEDAARADGAGPLRVLFSIWLPLALPAIVGGALVVFALSVSELAVSHLLCPPGYQTLAEHLFDRLHTGEVERVSSVAIIMVSVAAAALYAGLAMLRRAARRL